MSKKMLLTALVGIPVMVILILMIGATWNYLSKAHLRSLNRLLPDSALTATHTALTEQAALQAAEYQSKRLVLESGTQRTLAEDQARIEMIPKYTTLTFYGAVGILTAAGVSLIILSSGYARARIKRASVCTAKIGEHSAIPVHQKDLRSFYPIAVNLSLAEIEASVSISHEKAYQISRQMIEDITAYTRVLAGQRGLLAGNQTIPAQDPVSLPATAVHVPTFADLLKSEQSAPGSPLIFGYHEGQPEHRSLKDLKSVAVAGWQGSGKTSSTAYILASSVLAYGIQAYVIDPHKNHDEGLYAIIQPLEATGRVTVINPFDTPQLIDDLHNRLDRRLAGTERSDQGILLVIDELARLAKMDCFDRLVTFLERCTEETRKSNITFIGCSTKWTARYFKGRADIRGCMNSALVHRCKVSQAELLIEDSQEKKMVKHLERPGEAILMTDFAGARKVQMPYCTRQDMETIARMIGNGKPVIELHSPLGSRTSCPPSDSPPGRGKGWVTTSDAATERDMEAPQPPNSPPGRDKGWVTTSDDATDLSTEDRLRAKAKELREIGKISYGDILREAGIGKSTAHGWVNDTKKKLKPEQKTALRNYLERIQREPQRPAKVA